ncbi:MAG TPA: STAS domain-containing protein [Candidatus Aquicultor sp.]|jgi:anti-anti-sigma regulatory factor
MAQRAVAKKIEETPSGKTTRRTARSRKKAFSYSVQCDLTGTYEVTFCGCMTGQFLATNRFATSGISNEQIEQALLNLTDVTEVDDDGIELLLQLMRKLDKHNIRFQLIYSDGKIGSMIESSGVASYFAQPTWVYA